MMAETDSVVRTSRPAVAATGVINVVIVGWNSRSCLEPCLRSLRRCAGPRPFNVIVVDNNSSDDTAVLVSQEFPEVVLVQSGGNLGFGKGCNCARPYIQPGYVLFLNPDTEMPAVTPSLMADFLDANSSVGAVGCKMVFPDRTVADQNLQWFPSPLTEFITHAFLTDRLIRSLAGVLPWNDPSRSSYVRKLFGGCVMVSTVVLDRVGWFDERFFMYAEDVDLSRRIREAGWKLYYLGDAEVVHAYGAASKKAGSDFSLLMMCESMSQLIGKYQGPFAAFAYRLAIAAASLLRLAVAVPLFVLALLLVRARLPASRERIHQCSLRLKWALRVRRPYVP